jgi:outer membrane protein assembly factor BamB
MYRGGPAHEGVSTAPPLLHFGGVHWRVQTGGTVRASASIAGDLSLIGSSDSLLYAIDLATGRVRWRYFADAPVSSTVAISGTLAFVQSDDGVLHALNVRDGTRRWIRPGRKPVPLGWGHENGDYFTSSPVIDGHRVVVGGRDGSVVARDATTGAEIWRATVAGQIWGSPALSNGTIVVGSQLGVVYALDSRTGRERWRFRTVGDTLRSASFGFDRTTIQSSAAIVGDQVLFGARDGFLYSISLATGLERWRANHDVSWANGSPAVDRGLVFETTSDGAFVQAVDLATGVERWRVERVGLSWSSPLVAGEFVYLTTATGWVHALDRTTGAKRWAYRADGAIWSSPVLVRDLLLFGSDDGGVYALRGGEHDLQRVVWWDSTTTTLNTFAGHAELRDHLAGRDWRVLGTDGAIRFLQDRITDRAPSVVVFAQDQLPAALLPAASDTTLLRRYLNAGGKIVWTGIPPLLWPRDSTGFDFDRINRGACNALLQVDCSPANFNDWRATPTPAGRAWGLEGWWIARWSVSPRSVTTVLAYDQRGDASAFVKEFGGPPGSGFVRVSGGDNSPALRGMRRLDPAQVRRAAEHFPLAR